MSTRPGLNWDDSLVVLTAIRWRQSGPESEKDLGQKYAPMFGSIWLCEAWVLRCRLSAQPTRKSVLSLSGWNLLGKSFSGVLPILFKSSSFVDVQGLNPVIMNPANYRARLLLDLFHTFVLPTIVLSVVFSLFRYRTGLFSIPLHLAFIFTWVAVRVTYSELWHDRQAKSLGAKPIPRVVGKWPGNIDLLFTMMRGFSTSYVLDVYLQLFEEYQCTTLNLRILWHNSVRVDSLLILVEPLDADDSWSHPTSSFHLLDISVHAANADEALRSYRWTKNTPNSS